ncbi:hypothetical protein [Butyrivibrio sp. AE3006]|uniref:hypothetical protein n=1 Tax=Butyrivibrio sp. AE3006 TaxID=1280673 RepID=UPI00041CADF1|nr:hypothetical protein [Butyrivibrio sp. AE3006]
MKETMTYKEKISSYLFYYIFALWYTTEIVFNTDLLGYCNSALNNIMEIQNADINFYISVLVFVLLIVKICFLQKYSVNELLIIAFISLPVAFATIQSHDRVMVSLIMFVVASKNTDLNKTIRIVLIISLILIPVIMILCGAGMLHDYTMYRSGIIRHSMGFSHPNQLGIKLFQYMGCHYFIHRNRMFNVGDYLLNLFLVIFTYRVTYSQTAYIGLILLLIFMIIRNSMKKSKKVASTVFKLVIVGSVIINVSSIYLSIFYVRNNHLMKTINKLLSFRFSCGSAVYRYYGLTLFGQPISTLVKDKHYVGIFHQFYLDNAYMSILMRYGVIIYILFSVLLIYSMYSFFRTGNYTLVMLFFIYSIYGIMEKGLYTLAHNIFLIAMATIIYRQVLVEESDTPSVRYIVRLQ